MSDKTKITWADATWNPVTGCTQVSPGCDHCYAKAMAERFAGSSAYPQGFDVTVWPDRLDQPSRWQRPRRIFVCSMADLFHDAVPVEFIARVFAVAADNPRHTFLILTKRHGRMRTLLNDRKFVNLVSLHRAPCMTTWPLPNVWLGVTAENQQWYDTRVPALMDTPSALRFVSVEPMLGPMRFDKECPDWVIVGGESGPGARRMDPQWVDSLIAECERYSVPLHFKQLGTVLARELGVRGKGVDPSTWPEPWPREDPEEVGA